MAKPFRGTNLPRTCPAVWGASPHDEAVAQGDDRYPRPVGCWSLAQFGSGTGYIRWPTHRATHRPLFRQWVAGDQKRIEVGSNKNNCTQ